MTVARPPYTAVVFSSQRSETGHADEYEQTARQMVEMAQQQPGYLGVEGARGADGFGVTVSYWETPRHAQAWKKVTEHVAAQHRGARDWYADYTVRVATVERQYGNHRSPGDLD